MEQFSSYYNLVLESPALKALALAIISIAVAKFVDIIFTLIFKKVVKKTKTSLDDRILQLLHKPIFKTITILIWIFVISKILVMSMEWASRQTASNLLQRNTLPLFNNLGKIAIGLFGAYFIFLSWGININGILASAGVLGVVLGLAAKDTVSNFFAGIFLMADSPFKEGDYILLDTGERGYVKRMGLRSTRFMTRDDIEITIPNSVIAASKIVNESGGPGETERVRINIQIAYNTDIDKARSVLIDVAKNNENVLQIPEPRVRFREFADHGLRLQLLFWIHKPEIRGRTTDSVNTEIYKKFAEHNITIPFPTMEVLLPKNEN